MFRRRTEGWVRGLAAVLAALGVAPSRAESLADVRRACEEVRRTILSARAIATVERTVTFRAGSAARPHPPNSAFPRQVLPGPLPDAIRSSRRIERWAFAGEKRFYRPIPGYPTSYDGTYVRARMVYAPSTRGLPNPIGPPDGPHRVQPNAQIRGSIARAQLRARSLTGDPIQNGYKLLWRDPDGPDTQYWMRDLLRRVEPVLTPLPSGNLRLSWQRKIGRQREDAWAEIDPRRNYLIVRLERQWRAEGQDLNVRRAHQSMRVLRSQDMGGWHLPMATVEEETTTDGGSSRLDTKLSEVGTDVPDSLFTDIFEPGDWVDTESGPYRVGIDGRLEAVSPYPRYEASHKSPIPVVPIAVAGISGALVFLLASRWARSRGRDSGAGAVLERRR